MVTAAAKLMDLGEHEFFAAGLSPMALLDEDAVIWAANSAYLEATGSSRSDLLSQRIFDAFPDNPETPEARSVQRLGDSLERVLQASRPDHMGFQRYDVPNRAEPGVFVPKTWMPVNTPVRHEGAVIGVLHRVDDVTEIGHALHVPPNDTASGDDERPPRVSRQLEAVLAEAASLAAENHHLRQALESRAAIDAAKGMVMLECGCGPEAAFAFLKRLSADANVRVADLSAALVQHASEGRQGVREILGLTQGPPDLPV